MSDNGPLDAPDAPPRARRTVDVDRDAILSRRGFLVASALASAGLALGVASTAEAETSVFEDTAPDDLGADAKGDATDAGDATDTRPPRPSTVDAADASALAEPCLSAEVCLCACELARGSESSPLSWVTGGMAVAWLLRRPADVRPAGSDAVPTAGLPRSSSVPKPGGGD